VQPVLHGRPQRKLPANHAAAQQVSNAPVSHRGYGRACGKIRRNGLFSTVCRCMNTAANPAITPLNCWCAPARS
jgi:hypothetical protein